MIVTATPPSEVGSDEGGDAGGAAGGAVDLAILGAGMAGLSAAKAALSFGLRVLVLEARERVGGRAHTDDGFGFPLDLGGHWLHSADENPLVPLARELSVPYREAGPLRSTDHLGCGFESPETQRERVAFFKRALERVDEPGTGDFSVASLLAAERESPWWPRLVHYIAGVSGVEPELASSLDFARYQETERDFPVTGGLGTLVSRFARGLPVLLSAPVRAVTWGPRGVRLATPKGTVAAPAAIITLPTPALARQAPLFFPPLPEAKLRAAADLPLGANEKIVLQFEGAPFDFEEDFLTAYAPAAPSTMTFRFLRRSPPTVIANLSGSHCLALCKLPPERAVGAAMKLLSKVVGERALQSRKLVRTRVTQWTKSPWTGGSYSAALPGRAFAREQLAIAVGPLFFAGEATSVAHFSTVHGAYLSGLRAAEEASRYLGRRDSPASSGAPARSEG